MKNQKTTKEVILVSMTSFVMMQNINFANKDIDINQLALRNLLYAQLLTQPLTLGMFVPCDLNGNVLELPSPSLVAWSIDGKNQYDLGLERYQQAKERVLFHFNKVFFEFIKGAVQSKSNLTVEWLINEVVCILTPTAQKQIGLC